MTGISRRRLGRASWIVVVALACGGRTTGSGTGEVGPNAVRIVPASETIALETAGPPPLDTSVTFTTGELRTIVVSHGPPENIVFAELTFPPAAFADSGSAVQVDIRPRPGLYAVDIQISQPLRDRAFLVFKYGRYFLAPARARAVYGGDVQFERALAIGQVLPDAQLGLLPSTRPAYDNLRAAITTGGGYLVAAAQ